jgi:hypothetical protein
MKKTIAPAFAAAVMALASLGLAHTSAQAATKGATKPPARTQAAKATQEHNRKVEADKAKRNARMADEKAKKDAKKAAKANK